MSLGGGGGGGGGDDFSPHSADGCYFENANSLKAYATNNKYFTSLHALYQKSQHLDKLVPGSRAQLSHVLHHHYFLRAGHNGSGTSYPLVSRGNGVF